VFAARILQSDFKYEIVLKIFEGGMGLVHEAKQLAGWDFSNRHHASRDCHLAQRVPQHPRESRSIPCRSYGEKDQSHNPPPKPHPTQVCVQTRKVAKPQSRVERIKSRLK